MASGPEKKALPPMLTIAGQSLRRDYPPVTDLTPFADLFAKLDVIPDVEGGPKGED